MKQVRWWHGTTSAAKARAIMRDGFKPDTYFARNLEDALEFGGRHVFCVTFYITFKPGQPNWRRWQVKLSNRLPPDAIVSYDVYTIKHVKGEPLGLLNQTEHPEKRVRKYGSA